MDDVERYALDIEKIATGAGTRAERSSAVDMKLDECLRDLRSAGPAATLPQYLTALSERLVQLRPVLDDDALATLDHAIERLGQIRRA